MSPNLVPRPDDVLLQHLLCILNLPLRYLLIVIEVGVSVFLL